MSDLTYHVTVELTSVQVEMLLKAFYQGMATQMNIWRRPNEWVALAEHLQRRFAFALEPAR